jgi:hypothetical protein
VGRRRLRRRKKRGRKRKKKRKKMRKKMRRRRRRKDPGRGTGVWEKVVTRIRSGRPYLPSGREEWGEVSAALPVGMSVIWAIWWLLNGVPRFSFQRSFVGPVAAWWG